MKALLDYHDALYEGEKIGFKRGFKRGRRKGLCNVLMDFAAQRWGALPVDVEERLRAITDTQTLKELIVLVAPSAPSISLTDFTERLTAHENGK